MQRTIVGYVLLIALALGLNHYFTNVFPPKPDRFDSLESKLKFEQEKLISAQILASELLRVESLIENNLAGSKGDALTQEASVDFINEMIAVLTELNCEITGMKTYEKDRASNYVRTPYEVNFKGTYNQFGKFINRMEQSERLVMLELFKIDNNLTKLNFARTMDDLKTHDFMVKLSTLTLVRGDLGEVAKGDTK
jgi:Tfp pilus assembly protein PilO